MAHELPRTELEERAIAVGARMASPELAHSLWAAAGHREGLPPEQQALLERLQREPFALSRMHTDI